MKTLTSHFFQICVHLWKSVFICVDEQGQEHRWALMSTDWHRSWKELQFLKIGIAPLLIFPAISFAAPTVEQIEFFETNIRPILAQECYECHSSTGKQRSGLVLDYRDGLLKGGDIGPAVVPGKPEESVIMAVSYTHLTLPTSYAV